MFKPELLSPAGTMKNMEYAFAYGADAVYAGQPRYSLRVRNNEFDHDNLAKGIARAHELGKKFYVVTNIAAHNAKLKTFLKDIEPVINMKPDALIMSDPGMIMMVREHFPQQEIHLSVQSNAVNWATVKFWHQLGVTRVVLSRELSLQEIEEIREQVPGMELEVFVHGALCIAYSGRCLLSGYINKRDANQGTCTNACRWNYNTYEGQENAAGDVVGIERITDLTGTTGRAAPQFESLENVEPSHAGQNTVEPTLGIGETTERVWLLEEQGRPGELMPAYEDEHGTYIMNSKDLNAVELIPDLVKIGVHSLKIEGRTKSHYYVARTAQVYRKAIDDAAEGKPFDPALLLQLDGLASRGYTEGFLRRHVHSEYQNYDYGVSKSDSQRFVGEVIESNDEFLTIDVKNKFCVGDSIEIMTPAGNVTLVLNQMGDKYGNPIEAALGSGWIVQIPNPFKGLSAEVLKFGLVMRNEAWGGDSKRDSAAKAG